MSIPVACLQSEIDIDESQLLHSKSHISRFPSICMVKVPFVGCLFLYRCLFSMGVQNPSFMIGHYLLIFYGCLLSWFYGWSLSKNIFGEKGSYVHVTMTCIKMVQPNQKMYQSPFSHQATAGAMCPRIADQFCEFQSCWLQIHHEYRKIRFLQNCKTKSGMQILGLRLDKASCLLFYKPR